VAYNLPPFTAIAPPIFTPFAEALAELDEEELELPGLGNPPDELELPRLEPVTFTLIEPSVCV
jgi:hypothetical protein